MNGDEISGFWKLLYYTCVYKLTLCLRLFPNRIICRFQGGWLLDVNGLDVPLVEYLDY